MQNSNTQREQKLIKNKIDENSRFWKSYSYWKNQALIIKLLLMLCSIKEDQWKILFLLLFLSSFVHYLIIFQLCCYQVRRQVGRSKFIIENINLHHEKKNNKNVNKKKGNIGTLKIYFWNQNYKYMSKLECEEDQKESR